MSIQLLTKLVNAIESGATILELSSITSEARVYLDSVEREKHTLTGSEFDRDEFRNWLRSVVSSSNILTDDELKTGIKDIRRLD